MAALDELKREVDGAPITLLCHSVGWLGSIAQLDSWKLHVPHR